MRAAVGLFIIVVGVVLVVVVMIATSDQNSSPDSRECPPGAACVDR